MGKGASKARTQKIGNKAGAKHRPPSDYSQTLMEGCNLKQWWKTHCLEIHGWEGEEEGKFALRYGTFEGKIAHLRTDLICPQLSSLPLHIPSGFPMP